MQNAQMILRSKDYMKTIYSVAAVIVFLAAFTGSGLAQSPAQSKIAFINTEAFYLEKGGINTIINGYAKLDKEMEPDATKFEAKLTQFNTLKKTYEDLIRKSTGGVPIDQSDVETKKDQLQALQTEITRMQEDLKKKQEKRAGEILGPINTEVGNAILDYAKQKGYTAIFDIAAMVNARQLLYADTAADITDDFIKYYNANTMSTAQNQ